MAQVNKRRLVLHFDLNNTILMKDAAKGLNTVDNVRKYFFTPKTPLLNTFLTKHYLNFVGVPYCVQKRLGKSVYACLRRRKQGRISVDFGSRLADFLETWHAFNGGKLARKWSRKLKRGEGHYIVPRLHWFGASSRNQRRRHQRSTHRVSIKPAKKAVIKISTHFK